MKNILSINNIVCGYGKQSVLNGISFAVDKGDFTGVLGPNGSGKTTLLRAMTGFLPLMSGSVIFEGKELSSVDRTDFARKTAVVLQSREEVLINASVMDFVLSGRLPYKGPLELTYTKRDWDVAREAIDMTGLSGLEDRVLNEISGGERQRVFIARALAQEPGLMLLDEPQSHMDIGHGITLFEMITRLIEKKGITVFCVMHDINLAAKYCRRLMLINGGKIFCQGSVPEVVTEDNIRRVFNAGVKVYDRGGEGCPQIIY